MLSKVIAVIGGLVGFYVAGYTGVLLAVTNRPIWSDTPLLGMLFVVSAASISAALMILLAQQIQVDHARCWRPCTAWMRGWSRWNSLS